MSESWAGDSVDVQIPIPAGFSLDNLSVSPDWFEARDKILEKAETITAVSCPEENKVAAALLREITQTKKETDKCRLKITRPLDQIKKAIMEAYKNAQVPLDEAQKELKEMMVSFAKAEEAKRIEEKKKAEAEEAKKVEEQFNQHQQSSPEKNFVPVFEPVQYSAPAEKTFDSRITKTLQFEIIDINEVPRCFLKVDEKLIRESLKKHKNHYMEKCQNSEDGAYVGSGLKISIQINVSSR